MKHHFVSPRFVTKLLFSSLVLLTACSNDEGVADEDDSQEMGRLRVELTDAPSDDPNISTVYITLAGAAIDNTPLEQVSVRQTVDISNFTGGSTIQLGAENIVRAGSYSSLELTFDPANDAVGAGPGCYVQLRDGRFDALGASTDKIKVVLPVDFTVAPGGQTRLIADVDLRKAITFDVASQDYFFDSPQALEGSIRVVDAGRSGGIEGRVEPDGRALPAARIVYAYQTRSLDLPGARIGNFSAATSSDRVSGSGAFKLAFLPAGEYELLVVDYSDVNGDGRLELVGARNSDAAIGAVTRTVFVSTGAQVSATLTLGELLR